ncbi:MAG: hypothetical protein RBR15_17750, partial [Sphaerochaeta sp.]|nr:hypothetical protein [Sphaerochaeta sp.]
MNNYNELEKLCRTFDKGFLAIQDYMDEWGQTNKRVRKVMNSILTSGGKDNIVTEVEMNNAYLYLLSEFFQDGEAIKKVHAQHEAELNAVGKQVLSYWEKHPGFWLYFSVKEELDDDFWTIVDNMTGDEHLLYSPGVGILLDDAGSECLHFVCLMQPNGGCLQTIGQIKYNHLPVADFKFYCSLFKPEEGLKAILSKHYIQFWQLDSIANMTSIKRNGYELGYAWQPFSLPEFDTAKLGGKWNTWKHDAKVKYFIKEPDPSMDKLPSRKLLETETVAMGGSIVRDPKTGEMGLATNSEAAYPFYAAILNRAYPELKLPKEPSVFVTAPLRGLAVKTELPFPWKKFRAILEYKEEIKKAKNDFDAEDMLKLYHDIVAIYKKAQLSGQTLDMDAIAKATKLDKKTAERLFRGYDEFATRIPFGDPSESDDDYEEKVFKLPAKDKAFQLTGWEMPKDVDGGYLSDGLYLSELFAIKDEKEAYRQLVQLTNEAYAQELDRDGVCAGIEALFEETFDEDLVYPLMNTFFWLLYHKGKEWLPVRSYAIELLKWIPSPILREYIEYEDFIEEFSRFTKKLLCTKGICSLAKRPTA